MPTLKQQQEVIDALRLQRKQQSDALYSAQIQLSATKALLGRVIKNETSLPQNPQQIAKLNVQIEQFQAQLRRNAAAFNELALFFDRIKQNEQLINFLQKKIEVFDAQLNDNLHNLRDEEEKPEPDQKAITELNKKIDLLKVLSGDLTKNLDTVQHEGQILKQVQVETIEKQKQLETQRGELQANLASLQADLAGLLQQENRDNSDIVLKSLEERKARYEHAKAQNTAAVLAVTKAIGELYVDPHPRKSVAQLNDNIPFLFLPVRIETRFITETRKPELWLRVYPDDIAIHTHEKLLTAKELAEGIRYWKALFNAEKNGGDQKEEMKKAAWNALVQSFRPQRSAWITLQTKPKNWSDDLGAIQSADDLIFSEPELTKPDSWSRAPRVNVLPDKFVITLYEGDAVANEIIGNNIPDELFVGPDPMEPDASFVTKEEKLVFGESFDWTSDFDKAIQNGMGFKIPLTKTQAENGFTRILVLGINLSLSETSAKTTIEDLIDNHHYSPNGFSLLPQGTATNNTDNNGSGYTKNDALDIGYVTETGTPLFGEADDCDGKNLADALGIDYTPLQNILHSDGKDLKEAVAMNTALYPSTLGYYFDAMLNPVLNEVQQEKLRDFFIENVTGRGPLPTIRVGDQPYGILLTSNFDQWKWNTRREFFNAAFFDNRFLNVLYAVLKDYHEIWKSLADKLSYVGKPNSTPSEILMDIIGLQPNSASIYQRIGYSTDYLKNLDQFQFGGKYFKDRIENLLANIATLQFLEKLGYTAAKGTLKTPQLLQIIYQHYHTTLDAANIVDNVPLSETDAITPYDAVANKNYLDWLAEINSLSILEKQDFGAGIKVPTALMYLQLRRSLSLQLHKSSVLWFRKNNLNVDFTLTATNFHNVRPAGDLTKWEVMKAKLSDAAFDHPYGNKLVSEFLLGIGKNEDEAAFLIAMRKSLDMLAKLPTARLERCFMEHLDTLNYRLDAWQTGLFNLRLKQQRQLQNENRKKGIYLGSYGWIENIRPSGKRKLVSDQIPEKLKPKNGRPLFEYTDNGGFVHAPSLNHASAAALLRSGYISHASPENPDVMAVNLSSERVRRALFVLEGMRNGQSLEALLGYQFERGLHDRGSEDNALKKLNLYIYDFRDAFPLLHHHILQQGTNTAVETIPANNVVNGVTLAESTVGFPYGTKGEVLSATVSERNAIISEKDKLADTLDAVKDLLSAESVYQLVQGNFERAGALVNAIKDAAIPAELDVIDTPRGSQFSITNRVVINFGRVDASNPANNPWPGIAITPRAKMEAGINKWLGSVIGDPDKVVYAVSYLDDFGQAHSRAVWTLEQLKIQPVDLIYIIGNELNTGEKDQNFLSELESRIAYQYKRTNGIDDSVPVKIEFKQPEGIVGKQTFSEILPMLRMLRTLITDARFVDAEDFEPHSKTSSADKNNPKALDDVELLSRVEQIQASFVLNLTGISGLTILAQIPDPDANNLVTDYHNLKDAFAALDKAKLTFEEIDFSFGSLEATQLQDLLKAVSDFGVADAFPKYSTVLNNESKVLLLEQARSIFKRMLATDKSVKTLLTAALPLSGSQQKVSEYIRAGKLLLQEAFTILPLFNFNNDADVQLSQSDSAQLLNHAATELKMSYPVDEWLQNASHVRPRLSRWNQVRLLYELNNSDELKLQAIQLPYRSDDSWVAVEYPEIDPLTNKSFTIVHDTLSIVIHGQSFASAEKQSGILVDDWTEMMPTNEEITGITFNYNQPNAMPPQSLLLAVTPEVKGNWTWEDLIGILNDTLNRAKLRAVEPKLLDELLPPEINILRPAILADFSQYDLNVALDYRMNLEALATQLPIKTADLDAIKKIIV
ncbi:conserved hypothetical protein [Crenothrix polyspora]|uniref:Uncharacterized protein n=1 Tax=Crenothrix polyspora TaxID=360316 RepID=A0A1R4HHK0_9GAMM|nr:hypothetical protein [Crenothrix polyspora]SJM95718.1 conserved hypothetical protein [Crenothrix polyspora]